MKGGQQLGKITVSCVTAGGYWITLFPGVVSSNKTGMPTEVYIIHGILAIDRDTIGKTRGAEGIESKDVFRFKFVRRQ